MFGFSKCERFVLESPSPFLIQVHMEVLVRDLQKTVGSRVVHGIFWKVDFWNGL